MPALAARKEFEDRGRIAGATALTLLLAVPLGCAPYVYQAEFPVRKGSVLSADLLGPFNGQVQDAGTGKPVKGAIVFASWEVVRGYGFLVPGGRATHTARTGRNGRYAIPALATLPRGASTAIARFRLVIYKRGYVAYRSDRLFPGDARRRDFVQLDNVVKLERWNPELSRVDHVRFIGGAGKLGQAASWEVHAAVAEIEGRPYRAGQPDPKTPKKQLLNAQSLLDEDDIADVTKFTGSFNVSRLKDVPRSRRYDSKHFRAEGKGERFDLAYRVWKLDRRSALAHYKKLLGAYPNPSAKDELGERSFRSQNADITGVVWMDRKNGIVIALTCGRGLCQAPEIVVKLGQVIHGNRKRLRRGDAPPPRVPGIRIDPFRPVRPRVPVLQP